MSDQTNAVKVDIATINHFVNNSLLPSIIVMFNLFISNLHIFPIPYPCSTNFYKVFNQVWLLLLVGTADSGISDLLRECSDTSFISDFEEEFHSLNIDISNGPPIDIDNFIIVHYNINSILATDRIEQLSDICKTLNIDV